MKFDVEKMKQASRQMTESEREEIEYREKNREWQAMSLRFALTVRKILRSKNITQSELAKRLGVSPTQVTKILSGKENLGLQTMCKIEKALEQNIVCFTSEQGYMQSPRPNAVYTSGASIPVYSSNNSGGRLNRVEYV